MVAHRYPSYGKDYGRPRRREIAVLIRELKSVPCKDCGGTFPPECMDFDHVRGEKEFQIGKMSTYNRERILAEVAKCDIICANCHRIRTYKVNQAFLRGRV